ncbi:MAG: hypothetical protein AAF639_39790 [Chloroflexota bacterium]
MITTILLTTGILSAGYISYQRIQNKSLIMQLQSAYDAGYQSIPTTVAWSNGNLEPDMWQSFRQRTLRWLSDSDLDEPEFDDTTSAELNASQLQRDGEIDFDSYEIDLNKRGLILAMGALGVSSVGPLVYFPLKYLSIPLLAYMEIPAAQRAGYLLMEERKMTNAVIESLVQVGAVLFSILQGYYILGAIGFGGYYWLRMHQRQKLAENQHQRLGQILAWQTPTTAKVEIRGRVSVRPIHLIGNGDIVLIQTGDMVPVDGVIAQGRAWVKKRMIDDEYNNQSVAICDSGSFVAASDIVLIGSIRVRVETA